MSASSEVSWSSTITNMSTHPPPSSGTASPIPGSNIGAGALRGVGGGLIDSFPSLPVLSWDMLVPEAALPERPQLHVLLTRLRGLIPGLNSININWLHEETPSKYRVMQFILSALAVNLNPSGAPDRICPMASTWPLTRRDATATSADATRRL